MLVVCQILITILSWRNKQKAYETMKLKALVLTVPYEKKILVIHRNFNNTIT